MNQPKFWLQIRPSYVLENFEDLLVYVSQYRYDIKEPSDSDFNTTVDFLSKAAYEMIQMAFQADVDDMPIWEVETSKVIRMIGTAILAERKRGKEPYLLIVGLAEILALLNKIKCEETKSYIDLLNSCARRLTILSLPFNFSDFEESAFSIHSLAMRLPQIKWEEDDTLAYFGGKGTFIFERDGISICPLSFDEYKQHKSKLKKILNTDCGIYIADQTKKKIDDGDSIAMINSLPEILRALKSVKPSKNRKKMIFSNGEELDVRIIGKYGNRIECESLDSEYEKVTGYLTLNPTNVGIPKDYLMYNLKIGDVLPVRYYPDDECIFKFTDSVQEELEFKQTILNECSNQVKGIYLLDYKYGTRWLSELGLQINVLHKYDDYVDFGIHNDEGSCIKIKVLEIKVDNNGKVVINGEFLPETEQSDEVVCVEEFRTRAFNQQTLSFINYMNSSYTIEDFSEFKDDIQTSTEIIDALGKILLTSVISGRTLSSAERAWDLVLASSCFQCIESFRNLAMAGRETSFLKAAIGFARGESTISLNLSIDSSIEKNARSSELKEVVGMLKEYKESRHSIISIKTFSEEDFTQIEPLVNANNTLVGKIDSSELSRIKRGIANRLGVGDEFRDQNMDYSYYGEESDTLEFKISCVLPPKNCRTGIIQKDMDFQSFVILKTVCAFLNSPSGGDLLIGVNDNGYGIGVNNDVNLLYENKIIGEDTSDRLRIHIKNILDRGFVSNDGSVSGNAITVGHVWVNVEKTKNSKDIIRVKVTPYPYDVIRILQQFVPNGCKDAFYRTSGSSEPLNAAGVRNTRLDKLSRLDPNEYKIATILEAIDNKCQLQLREYHSASGLSDRRIEPHCLMQDQKTVQAFDHKTKKMKMFRLARMGRVEKLDKKWEYEKKHTTLLVDGFGIAQSDISSGEIRKVKVSDYALLLLLEEYPNLKTCAHFKILENNECDKNKFSYIVEMLIFSQEPLLRFTRGLPEQTSILDK